MRSGAEYREALRDGRKVWIVGEGLVDDVTLHPATRPMVDEYVTWRPWGYFGHGRDTFTLDGAVPDGINKGVPRASGGRVRLTEAAARCVIARFSEETIVTRTWPMADEHISSARS